MKKITITFWIIVILTLFFCGLLVYAKLSDETSEEVDKLRFKHYMQVTDLDYSLFYCAEENTIKWTRDFLSIKVEDDKLIIETQDGKWFIEMEKVKGE